jgi:hypothetical protein
MNPRERREVIYIATVMLVGVAIVLFLLWVGT